MPVRGLMLAIGLATTSLIGSITGKTRSAYKGLDSLSKRAAGTPPKALLDACSRERVECLKVRETVVLVLLTPRSIRDLRSFVVINMHAIC